MDVAWIRGIASTPGSVKNRMRKESQACQLLLQHPRFVEIVTLLATLYMTRFSLRYVRHVAAAVSLSRLGTRMPFILLISLRAWRETPMICLSLKIPLRTRRKSAHVQ